jgi:NADPH:quinone reductase-like Zn-dependent oxidoreductase
LPPCSYLKFSGYWLLVSGCLLLVVEEVRRVSAKFIFLVKSSGEDLAYLNTLIEAGKMHSVIDRTYPISEIAAAHRYSEEGHVAGKIALCLAGG